MSTGMIILNTDFQINGIDPIVEKLFGYEKKECLGHALSLLIPSFNSNKFVEDVHLVNQLEITAYGIHKNGTSIRLEYYLHLINHQEIKSFCVMINELSSLSTEIRHQQSNHQAQGQEWLGYLLQSSPIVIYSCRPKGNFATTFISENVVALTGYTQEQYLSDINFWLNHLHPEDKTEIVHQMSLRIHETDSHSFEYRFLCADGKYKWILDKLKISHDNQGTPTEILGYWLEITERKQAEQELLCVNAVLEQKTNSLTAANQDLSQFTHVVSHDLKAPLRAIHSYCEWLKNDLEGTLAPEHQEYFTGMQDAVQQAERLIDDLLDLSEIGHNIAEKERVSLTEFFTELTDSVITDPLIDVSIMDHFPYLYVSPVILTQVFQNLITNASVYNLSDSKTIVIDGQQFEDCYHVSITDNGMGIESKFHDRIFQLFQRLHTKEEFDGTGVGLAIVQKAVTNLDWAISLQSAETEGSTFTISIPLKEVIFND